MLVLPAQAIGDVELGMSELEVRQAVGEPGRLLDRMGTLFEIYPFIGLQIGYSSGTVDFITVHQPGEGELYGEQLIGVRRGRVVQFLEDQGVYPEEVEPDGSNYYFRQVGFALTSSEEIITGCSVFGPGYYEI